MVIGEPCQDRVAGFHAKTGHAQIFAQPPGRARQQERAAHVRDQPDPAFRHGHAAGFPHDPVAGMASKADAAAHGEPLHEAGHGLGKVEQRLVDGVFRAPEVARGLIVASHHRVVDARDIAARAEGLVAFGVDHQHRDIFVCGKAGQGLGQRIDHVPSQRVQCLGAGQRDTADAAGLADFDIAHRFFSMSRATIIRMISFVPSRIRWTRRSRTTFSIP